MNAEKIIGLKECYIEAISVGRRNTMTVNAGTLMDAIERISELENAVIDMRASLRTCKNTSTGALDQYGDL